MSSDEFWSIPARFGRARHGPVISQDYENHWDETEDQQQDKPEWMDDDWDKDNTPVVFNDIRKKPSQPITKPVASETVTTSHTITTRISQKKANAAATALAPELPKSTALKAKTVTVSSAIVARIAKKKANAAAAASSKLPEKNGPIMITRKRGAEDELSRSTSQDITVTEASDFDHPLSSSNAVKAGSRPILAAKGRYHDKKIASKIKLREPSVFGGILASMEAMKLVEEKRRGAPKYEDVSWENSDAKEQSNEEKCIANQSEKQLTGVKSRA